MTSIEHTKGYYLILVQIKKHTKQFIFKFLYSIYTFDT